LAAPPHSVPAAAAVVEIKPPWMFIKTAHLEVLLGMLLVALLVRLAEL
jgi:hypothetical protein